MKKMFVLFLLTVFSFIAHAETGYRGLQWYDSVERCSKIGHLIPYFKDGSIENILLEDMINMGPVQIIKKDYTVILGKLNNVAYLFKSLENETCLVGVSYTVTSDKIKEIINRFKVVRKYKTSKEMILCYWFEDETLTSLGLSLDLEDMPQEVDELGEQLDCFIVSDNYELFGEDGFSSHQNLEIANEQNENLSGTLYIFDYNKDTRMYVFENIIKDKAVVVYVPHEQDY